MKNPAFMDSDIFQQVYEYQQPSDTDSLDTQYQKLSVAFAAVDLMRLFEKYDNIHEKDLTPFVVKLYRLHTMDAMVKLNLIERTPNIRAILWRKVKQ